MQIRAEPEKSALPICNYSQILYQFFKFTQNLKQSQKFLPILTCQKLRLSVCSFIYSFEFVW